MSSWISVEKFRRRTGASLRSAFCVMLGANTMLGVTETQLVFALRYFSAKKLHVKRIKSSN